ncbi:hypothetical protein K503DRAFT_110048 [Rhizopogon vinicolor AM-OR11-026]|uniref:F-box domain-containing protein n=1 Tax=Rhizopogon vinicolor AM-OR11-026 TaxID=1314800 RepID=A0A1B7N2T7_9AGAM|nr:hypothetical protein K503DRAFT_110048 [Rhizopogon vinicolor AM-OR11-026]
MIYLAICAREEYNISCFSSHLKYLKPMETCSDMILPLHGPVLLSFTDSDISPISPSNPSHIHRLPAELLQHIFLLIVNDVSECPSIFSFGDTTVSANFTSPPLVFTHVCRLWRIVAQSTTRIWSRIQVGLPGRAEPFKPFLTSLLQSWLAYSGSCPLTLRIDATQRQCPIRRCSRYKPYTLEFTKGDSQLLEILLAERKRWEAVAVMSRLLARYGGRNFDTPRLSTLECSWWDIKRFNAPHLSRLRIVDPYLHDINVRSIPTCKNIRHIHIQSASVYAIRCILDVFPDLESIMVDVILSASGDGATTVTHPCLESMTLPLASNPHLRGIFIELFKGLHLPMLWKLTVVGEPKKPEVDCIVKALEGASCRVRVVDFQTDLLVSEVDKDIVRPLFSVAREMTLCGHWESAVLSCPLRLHM